MKNGKSTTLELPHPPTRHAGPISPARLDGFELDHYGSPATLNILLLYEDVSVALRGKQVIERLEAEMQGKPRIIVQSWRFETLNGAILRKMATEDAAQAAMVFLALHGHRELFSPILRAWLETWLRTREISPGALVLSFDANLEGTIMAESSLAYLHQITASANVMVFPHFGERPPAVKGWMGPNAAAPRATSTPFS